jgi:hypothetical protein
MEPRDTILYVPFSFTSNRRASSKAAGPTRCCYGCDPDGNVVELLEFTRPDDPLRLGF